MNFVLSEMASSMSADLNGDIEGWINDIMDEVDDKPASVRGAAAAAVVRLRSAQESIKAAAHIIEEASEQA